MHKILFVDDDPGMRLLMKRVLSFDFHVETADSGEAAIRMMEESSEPFAAVVADMSMARGNGLQLLQAVRENSPETARILMSGDHSLAGDPESFAEADVFRLLLKPVDNPTVVAAVRSGVERYLGMAEAVAA